MSATYWAIGLIFAFAIEALIGVRIAFGADDREQAGLLDDRGDVPPPMWMPQRRHSLLPEAPPALALTAEPHCWEPAWNFNTQELRLFIASADGEVVKV